MSGYGWLVASSRETAMNIECEKRDNRFHFRDTDSGVEVTTLGNHRAIAERAIREIIAEKPGEFQSRVDELIDRDYSPFMARKIATQEGLRK